MIKKYIPFILLFLLVFTVSGCGKDKLAMDISTYVSASSNCKNTLSVEYSKNVTITEKESAFFSYVSNENSNVQVRFYTDRTVEKLYLKKTESKLNITTANLEIHFDNKGVYLHTDIPGKGEDYSHYNTSYGNHFTLEDEFHRDNLIPCFTKEQISDFKIEKHSLGAKATFKAAALPYLDIEELIDYEVIIDPKYNFKNITYSYAPKVENKDITIKVEINIKLLGSFVNVKELTGNNRALYTTITP